MDKMGSYARLILLSALWVDIMAESRDPGSLFGLGQIMNGQGGGELW